MKHISVIYIQADLDQVWQGITSAEFTRRYWHKTDIESDWQVGADVTFYNPDKSVAVAGKVLKSEPPNHLSYTWHVHYNPEAKKEAPSRVAFDLEAVADATKLTVTHDDFPINSVVFAQIDEGWIAILSNLKTLLETEQVMAIS